MVFARLMDVEEEEKKLWVGRGGWDEKGESVSKKNADLKEPSN